MNNLNKLKKHFDQPFTNYFKYSKKIDPKIVKLNQTTKCIFRNQHHHFFGLTKINNYKFSMRSFSTTPHHETESEKSKNKTPHETGDDSQWRFVDDGRFILIKLLTGFGVAGIGGVGLTITIIVYILNNPKKFEEFLRSFPNAYGDILKIKQEDRKADVELKIKEIEIQNQGAFTDMQSLFSAYNGLVSTIGLEKWKQFMHEIGEIYKGEQAALIKKLEKDLEELNEKLNTANNNIDEISKKSREELKRTTNELNEKINKFEKEKENLLIEIRQLDTLIYQNKNQMKTALSEKIKDLQEQSKTNQDLSIKNKKLETDLKESLSTNDQLRKNNLNYQNSVNSLNKKLDLLMQCPKGSPCAIDLHRYLYENTSSLSFEEYHEFSPRSIELISLGLEQNLNQKIHHLDFYGTYLKGGAEFIKLMKAFESNKTITSINLGWTTLGRTAGTTEISGIEEMLKKNTTLKKISFYYWSIGDNEAEILFQALNSNKNRSLEEIDFKDTKISESKKAKFRTIINTVK